MIRRALALGVVLAAGSALAQEPGFNRTRVPGKDLCLHWAVRKYVYNYHAEGSALTPGNAEFVAMESAFDTWRALAQSCSDMVLEPGPTVEEAWVGYDRNSAANTNLIVFRELSCRAEVPLEDECREETRASCANKYGCWDHGEGVIALTTTTFSTSSGVIFDADIEFNASPSELDERFLFTTISSPPCDPDAQSPLCSATDVQNTLTHEIGHVIGLDHVTVTGSTMEATAPLGETRKRIIDSGTAEGFCRIYSRGRPNPPCEDIDALGQKVVAVNRGTVGLSSIGCAAAGGGLGISALLPLWLALRLWRRRRQPA